MKIGIIAMSGKPPTSGHFALIKIAARECDEVELFVSLNDRRRDNEVVVLGSDMEMIWNTMIEPSLPKNVNVVYVSKATPIKKVYEFLGKANEGSNDVYVIYSDTRDIQKNFPAKSLEKYLNGLYTKNQIVLEPISRSETVDVSGTKMRQWLKDGDKESFIAHLPDMIQDRGEQIWTQLQVSAALTTRR